MTPVIADTSAWIQYFRAGQSHEAREVRSLIESDRVVMIGIVYAELLRGARTPADADVLAQTLDSLSYLEFNRSTWRLAGELLVSLERTGERVPVPDALIAAIAIQNGSAVYSQDRHFRRFADLELHVSSNV